MLLQNPFGPASTTMLSQGTPQGTPPNNGAQPPNNDPNNRSGSGTNPQDSQPGGSGNDTTTGGAGNDPLMDFGKLWQNEPADPNKQTQNQPDTFLPALDPAKLKEHIGRMDFSKVISPEHSQAIAAGGEGAAKAVGEIINGVARTVMESAFTASHKLVESGLKSAKTRFDSGIPDYVKNIMVENNLSSSNPIMADPAFAPIVEGVRSQFQAKHPKATPAQIEKAVNSYFEEMGKRLSKKEADAANAQPTNTQKIRSGDPNADWEDWFNAPHGSSNP